MEENNKTQNNNLPYIIIIVLLVIIAILAFFVWAWYNWNLLKSNNNPEVTSNSWSWSEENISVTVVWDERCTNCNTDELMNQLKSIPFLAGAEFTKIDFSDEWTEEFLKANEVTKLPAFLFNTNNVSDTEFKWFLTQTPSWLYSLNVWANYNPYVERSERGFMILDDETLSSIKENSHIYWNTGAEITWVEYSDLDCHYCQKLHNDWTHEKLFEKFWDNLNFAYQYFAIFNKVGPQVLECIAEQKWEDILFPTISKAYKEEKTTKEWLISLVEWINEEELNECVDSWKYEDRINTHMEVGSQVFGITWTPWNVLINNETWEYEILPWAYPVSEFERVINSLMLENNNQSKEETSTWTENVWTENE